MFTDPVSVFLWMTALLLHGRPIGLGAQLGELIWMSIEEDCAPGGRLRVLLLS